MKFSRAFTIVVLVAAIIITSVPSLFSQSSCVEKDLWIRQLKNMREGWSTKFAENSRELSRNHLPLQERDVVVVQFQPSASTFEFPELLVNQCDQSATLNKAFLELKRVTAYQRNGRTFAWALYGTIVSGPASGATVSGADLNIVLSDTQGTGKFDVMRIGASFTPVVPGWIN